MQCPICLDDDIISIFTNRTCGHSWCKQCHHKLIEKKFTTCCLCREKIVLKRKPTPRDNYIDWLLEGGEPCIRWRNKRWRKKHRWWNI